MNIVKVVAWGLTDVVWFVCLFGFFALQPNMGAVLILFGKYKGTVTASGFHWANPLYLKKKVTQNDEKHEKKFRGTDEELVILTNWLSTMKTELK